MTNPYSTPQEQPAAIATSRRRFSIGLPACNDPHERRFPLTPEGVKALVEKGYHIKMERDAASDIHYADAAYIKCGAEITDRAAAMGCDIVIHLAPLAPTDIRRMRRGAMLLTLLHAEALSAATVVEMMRMAIIGVSIDLITDERGNRPFADILSEIDGRAAIATASSLLADSIRGKGILLGGIAGINPCEVTIFGSGIAAIAAARSACGLGAIVRMFDDDVYALRAAVRDLGPQVIGSVLHPRVVDTALRTSDVVIAACAPHRLRVDADEASHMKKGVVTFDLTSCPGRVFPSMPLVDLASAHQSLDINSGRRVCYINTGSAVPRTAAMALSNTFYTMLDSIVSCEGLTNALKLTPGLRRGVITFLGKVTNPRVADIAATRFTDINIFLQLC
ncbi:MAG: hypothetical protein K2N91_08080 [Muribaculaceae bacterium]|nr:hypothetical protein [Muribaculaceae bacterium]